MCLAFCWAVFKLAKTFQKPVNSPSLLIFRGDTNRTKLNVVSRYQYQGILTGGEGSVQLTSSLLWVVS